MVVTLLVIAFILHIAFAIAEMDPFEPPLLLKRVIGMKPWVGSWPDDESCGTKNPATDFNPAKARKLTATITRNAGAYNVIMALGFLWCWFPGVLAFPTDNQSVAAIRSFFSVVQSPFLAICATYFTWDRIYVSWQRFLLVL